MTLPIIHDKHCRTNRPCEARHILSSPCLTWSLPTPISLLKWDIWTTLDIKDCRILKDQTCAKRCRKWDLSTRWRNYIISCNRCITSAVYPINSISVYVGLIYYAACLGLLVPSPFLGLLIISMVHFRGGACDVDYNFLIQYQPWVQIKESNVAQLVTLILRMGHSRSCITCTTNNKTVFSLKITEWRIINFISMKIIMIWIILIFVYEFFLNNY